MERSTETRARDVSVDSPIFNRALDARLFASMAAAGSLSFCAVVFETAMNVALPTLMSEFAVGTATIQWITSGYLLMLSIVIPTFPYLKSRFSLRGLFMASVALFIAGTLMCGLAPAFQVLLAGRLVQGVGTGVAIPLMFSIVVDQVPHRAMGTMMGFASLVTALAPAVGPAYGGFIMGVATWRWVFLSLAPLVVAAAAIGAVSIRQTTALSRSRFDAVGFVLVAVGFFSLVYATNLSSERGWLSLPVLRLLAVCVVALGAYAVRSRRVASPLIDISMFSNLPFSCEVLVIALISFAILGFAYLVPNYAQLTLGADALTSGSLLLPGCVASVLLGPVGGRLLDCCGARVPIALGGACLLASTFLYVAASASLTPALLMGIYVIFGMGQGLAMSTSMTHGLAQLSEDMRTSGNSAFNTMQQLGGSVGVSVVTAIVGSAQTAGPSAEIAASTRLGGSASFLVLAGCMLAACLLGLVALGASRKKGC